MSKNYYLVERPDEEYPWDVVKGNPITGTDGIRFKDGSLARCFVNAINSKRVLIDE